MAALDSRSGIEVVAQFAGPVPACEAVADDSALKGLGKIARDAGADIGALISRDGTAVRFTDEKGRAVPVDCVALMLAKAAGPAIAGKRVVLDARCGQELAQELTTLGAEAVFQRPGADRLVRRAVEEGAAFVFDIGGACGFAETNGAADGLYALLRVAEALRAQDEPMSKVRESLPAVATIGDVRVDCPPESFHTILNRIRAHYPSREQTEVEGLRVRLEKGWALCVPEGDEGQMLLRFQAVTQERVEEIAGEFIDFAPEFRQEARRLAGLPDLPPREETYEDWR